MKISALFDCKYLSSIKQNFKGINSLVYIYSLLSRKAFPHFFYAEDRVPKSCAICVKCNYIYILQHKKSYFSTDFLTEVVKIIWSERARSTLNVNFEMSVETSHLFTLKKF